MQRLLGRVMALGLGSIIVACGGSPTPPVQRATLAGTFALRLLDGQPLPRPALFLRGMPDQPLLADTLTLTADGRFTQDGFFAESSSFGGPVVTMGVAGAFTQAGEQLGFGPFASGRASGDSLEIVSTAIYARGGYRWTYTRASR